MLSYDLAGAADASFAPRILRLFGKAPGELYKRLDGVATGERLFTAKSRHTGQVSEGVRSRAFSLRGASATRDALGA